MTRRLAELLAAAKLADSDVAQAQARAGRDARNLATTVEALKSLGGAIGQGIEGYGKDVADEAMQGAEQLVAENAATVGDAAETPEHLAKRLVASDQRVAAPEKTGDVFKDFIADPFGYRSRAAKAAQTAAQAKIGAGVHGARDKAAALATAAEATEYARAQDTQKREDTQNETEAARAEREQARMDALEQRSSASELAYDTAERDRALRLEIERMKTDAKAKGAAAGASSRAAKDSERKGRDAREDADSLRQEFNARPEVKDFSSASIAHSKMKKSAEQKTPAGDIALIYAFNKVQDPGSTVRESEFATAAMAGNFGDQMANLVGKVVSGERLTDAQRADLLQQAANFLASHKDAYDAQVSRFADIAKRRGAPIEDILPAGSTTPTTTPAAPPKPEAKAMAQQLLAQGKSPDEVREILKARGLY